MKKIGLKDVAQHVGVSVALVSYVLNGQAEEKQVGKEVAEKIRKAAIELNYVPNQAAKSLKTQRTQTIGLVVADINYRFSSGITRAIESEAKRKNFTVIFGSSNESNAKFDEIVNVLANRQVDGLILVPVHNSEDTILRLQQSEVPFILIDRNFQHILTSSISLDNYKAAYDSTSYLIKMGHKRIGFINYEATLFNLTERNRGYKDALKAHGLKADEHLLQKIGPLNPKAETSKAINRLLAGEHKCDALFFATDRLAIFGLQHLNELKLNVPKDISVFSFDAAEAFDLFYCPVTHASQPLEKMGKMAVNSLIDIINKNKVINQIYLETEFVIGKSCRE
ncbi:MAG TPA: LacI family DNA-binding transcriptional regulator [Mucilaginibacter sp.]|nr:LacI family DNA-binding transcriptional regulator [Mucilaginibacter sp.]